ncbi:glycoside hydrolase family 5 protein [Chenggangzhangella methanolivorans]|uniref:Glycoside hydrolase family 5 protein n=1 Tax=Chenggangzhangella methanolivorans TaxID=1437009 RepID=A0A9E6RDS4_9HYPH|nr:glycoside hydrolase family 5 protein [Chenggangzhangella methanolivorans]QZO01494.1 glycoside hydrolase family 5 protein [Chenggangzhangella methanolivorans]
MRIPKLSALAAAAALSLAAGVASAEPCLRGVNVAGAEFGDLPGKADKDYAYPSEEALKRIAADGATAIRLPFRWERLQPKLGRAFDTAELARLSATVDAAGRVGLIVILDPHNYAYYNKARIGTSGASVSGFADFWARLAARFKTRPTVVFSLMNEPYDISAADWAKASNAAIEAIRKTGALNFLIVPGTAYTGAHSWASDLATGRNDREMLAVSDPLDRFAFDFHQYLDADFSGRSPDCPAADRAIRAIDDVSAWLKANGKRGFLGEVAASSQPQCVAAFKTMIKKLNDAPDLWIGWTAWSAGAWWPRDYMFNLEPTAAGDAPQWAALKPLLADGAACDLAGRP